MLLAGADENLASIVDWLSSLEMQMCEKPVNTLILFRTVALSTVATIIHISEIQLSALVYVEAQTYAPREADSFCYSLCSFAFIARNPSQ